MRLTVRGQIAKRGTYIGWANVQGQSIMLAPVTTPDGDILVDHMWFKVGKRLMALRPAVGDTLELSVRVRPYKKCFIRRPGQAAAFKVDYGLSFPTNIRKITVLDWCV